ncbi:MAG: PAS domain-containing sensor histidine kinase, partial [Rhodanobacter sp.]
MDKLTWRQWAEQVATGMALVGADMRVRWINPALAERLALGARSVTGQPLSLLMPD